MLIAKLHLNPSLYVHNETLGKNYKTKIGAIDCTLCFPKDSATIYWGHRQNPDTCFYQDIHVYLPMPLLDNANIEYDKRRSEHLNKLKLECLDSVRLVNILAYVEKSTSIPREFNILLDAYYYKSLSDNKSAILYGATALEPTLLKRLKKVGCTFYKNDPPGLGKIFSILGGMLRLPSEDWQKKIVDVRNGVLHGRIGEQDLTSKIIKEYLHEVERFLLWLFEDHAIWGLLYEQLEYVDGLAQGEEFNEVERAMMGECEE